MDTEDQEVIFESWVQKYQGTDGKHTLRLSSSWKKRYTILLRHGSQAHVLYYDKKPKTLQDPPKGRIPLITWYTVQKKQQFRGQANVCEIATATSKLLHFAVEEEKMFHLLCFFLQAQMQLKEGYEGECFVVRPDGSNEHMKLGSRGSICLLHISQGGITLALQLSRCVLTQWPLNCIKLYESTERGQFILEIGKHAPTGPGKFVFNTRHEDNNRMYDILDKFVMELVGLKQLAASRSSAQSITLEKLIEQQYSTLAGLVQARSDPRFIAHLKRVSRGIYDQLAEHLGVTSHAPTEIASSESPDGPPMMTFGPKRSNSQQGARPKEPIPKDNFPSMSLGRRPKKSSPIKMPNSVPKQTVNTPSPQPHTVPSTKLRSKPPKKALFTEAELDAASSIDSQYLDMGSPSKKSTDSSVIGANRYPNKPQAVAGPVYKNVQDEARSPPNQGQGQQRTSNTDIQYLPMSGSETSPSNRGNSFVSDTSSNRGSAHSSVSPYIRANGSTPKLSEQQSAEGSAQYMQPINQNTTQPPNGHSGSLVGSPEKGYNSGTTHSSAGRPQSLPGARASKMYEDMSGSQPGYQDMHQSSPIRSLDLSMARTSTFYEDMGNSPQARGTVGQARSPGMAGMYEDMEGSKGHLLTGNSPVPSKPTKHMNVYNRAPLHRQLSRSCEDLMLGEYSQVVLAGEMYENDASKQAGGAVNNADIYSYARRADLDLRKAKDRDPLNPANVARPTELDLANFEKMIKRLPTVRDKQTMYSRPIPKHLRKSVSASNLLDLNQYEPPPIDKLDGNYHMITENNNTYRERKVSGNRPPNFDFSKLNDPHPERVSATEFGSPSDPIYKQVGNSKFWSPSPDEMPSPSKANPMTMKGISVTEQTRVFSRKTKSPEKQGSPATAPVDLRISDGSMRGRRLPSLPAGAKLPLELEGMNAKGTLC